LKIQYINAPIHNLQYYYISVWVIEIWDEEAGDEKDIEVRKIEEQKCGRGHYGPFTDNVGVQRATLFDG
jgi:hypothetical protein